MGRAALIVAHTSRDLITRKAAFAVHELIRAGFEVRMLEREARECCITDVMTVAEALARRWASVPDRAGRASDPGPGRH